MQSMNFSAATKNPSLYWLRYLIKITYVPWCSSPNIDRTPYTTFRFFPHMGAIIFCYMYDYVMISMYTINRMLRSITRKRVNFHCNVHLYLLLNMTVQYIYIYFYFILSLIVIITLSLICIIIKTTCVYVSHSYFFNINVCVYGFKIDRALYMRIISNTV